MIYCASTHPLASFHFGHFRRLSNQNDGEAHGYGWINAMIVNRLFLYLFIAPWIYWVRSACSIDIGAYMKAWVDHLIPQVSFWSIQRKDSLTNDIFILQIRGKNVSFNEYYVQNWLNLEQKTMLFWPLGLFRRVVIRTDWEKLSLGKKRTHTMTTSA